METLKKKGLFDWFQLIILLLAAPLFLFPRGQWAWVLGIIPLLWVTRKFFCKSFIESTLLDIPIFIILAQVLLTSLFVGNPVYGFSKTSGFLLAIALYYAVAALLKTGKLLKLGIFAFLGGSFMFSLVALSGMSTFKVKHLDFLMKIKEKIPQVNFGFSGAARGFQPNAVGGILILSLPLLAVLLYAFLPKKLKPFRRELVPFYSMSFSPFLLGSGLLIIFFVLLLTQSRGSWLGLFAGTVIVFLAILRDKRISIAVLVIFALMFSLVIGYSVSTAGKLNPGARQVEGTLLFRVQVWDIVLPVIHSHPLLGIGMGHLRFQPGVKYFWSHAHNQFMHIAVELGIPALIGYLALLLLTAYMVIAVFKKKEAGGFRGVVLGLVAGQLAFFVFGLTDAIPFGSKVGIFPWLSLALIAAIYNFHFKKVLNQDGHDGQDDQDSRLILPEYSIQCKTSKNNIGKS